MTARSRTTTTSVRTCAAWGCDDPLPPDSRADRVYCSERCSQRVSRARVRARERREAGLPPTRTDRLLAAMGLAHDISDGATTNLSDITTTAAASAVANRDDPLRDGPIPADIGGAGFQRFAHSSLPDQINDRIIEASDAADALGVSRPTISQWMALYNAARSRRQAAEQWRDDPAIQSLREYALSSFSAFTEVFFPDDLVPDFHVEWDIEITAALDDGERTMLLAPQRHGKTSFVIRQILYRIARDPDIRIIVVSKTQDLASKITGAVRQYLENDPQLAQVLLPPDTSFRPPPRRGVPWTNSEFVVATRTRVLKSPTMVALGIGGSILGRDADLIVIDDPIDRAGMLSPTVREQISEWFFTDFNSRIEEHTGVIYIGSRQHKQDLPGELIKRNAERMSAGHDPDWKVMVYRAHDNNCGIPLEDHEEDDTDCILWPELRTARWLAEQQRNNPEHFQRNYLNSPSSDAFKPVKGDDIEMSYAYDEVVHRILHDSPVVPRTFGTQHPQTMLVASVDPAVAKKNASVLWCYRTSPLLVPVDPADPNSKKVPVYVRALVDFIETRPGSPGVVDALDEWYDRYHVTDWVFETNYFADQIANDTEINDLRSRRGMRFHTHYTSQHNKHDSRAGVLAMLSSMGARPTGLLLPGGTPESRNSLTRIVQQMLNYDPEATHHSSGRKRAGLDDDLVMAAWFGWYWIEQKTKTRSSDVVFEYGAGFSNFEPSHWTTPPWRDIA